MDTSRSSSAFAMLSAQQHLDLDQVASLHKLSTLDISKDSADRRAVVSSLVELFEEAVSDEEFFCTTLSLSDILNSSESQDFESTTMSLPSESELMSLPSDPVDTLSENQPEFDELMLSSPRDPPAHHCSLPDFLLSPSSSSTVSVPASPMAFAPGQGDRFEPRRRWALTFPAPPPRRYHAYSWRRMIRKVYAKERASIFATAAATVMDSR